MTVGQLKIILADRPDDEDVYINAWCEDGYVDVAGVSVLDGCVFLTDAASLDVYGADIGDEDMLFLTGSPEQIAHWKTVQMMNEMCTGTTPEEVDQKVRFWKNIVRDL